MADANETSPAHARLPKLVRVVKARPRLTMSTCVGAATFAVVSLTDWRLAVRLLVAWDVGVALYLVLAVVMMARSETHHIRRRSRLQDDGQATIMVLIAVAALASLAAIFVLLGTGGGSARKAADLLLATGTILLSWAFTHTMFALHYAHQFYDQPDDKGSGKGGGMQFPGDNPEPDYWDFMYFAFVIGMCAQVSDVTVTCRPIRRSVFAHSVISFIFNAALLALTVNIAASAI